MTNVISMLIAGLVFICNGYSITKDLAKIKNIHLTVNKSTVKALLQVSAVLITAMCAGAGIIVSVAPDTGSIVGFGLAAAAIAVYFTAKNSAEKLAVAKLLMLGSVGCYVGILGIMQNVELTENAWGWLVGLKAQSDGFKTAIFGTLIPLLFVETDEPPVQKVGRWFTRQSIRTYFWCMRQLSKVNALLERAASTARAHLCALCQTVKSSINSVFAELAKLGSAVLDCLACILTPLISHLGKAAACAGAILLLTVFVSIQRNLIKFCASHKRYLANGSLAVRKKDETCLNGRPMYFEETTKPDEPDHNRWGSLALSFLNKSKRKDCIK